ncbi:unnamed protein product, partial [Ectocarpus sp. 13 AM-2016]
PLLSPKPSTSSPTERQSITPRLNPVSRTTIWQMEPLLASSRGHAVPRRACRSVEFPVFRSRKDKAFSLCWANSTAARARTEKPSMGRATSSVSSSTGAMSLVGIELEASGLCVRLCEST